MLRIAARGPSIRHKPRVASRSAHGGGHAMKTWVCTDEPSERYPVYTRGNVCDAQNSRMNSPWGLGCALAISDGPHDPFAYFLERQHGEREGRDEHPYLAEDRCGTENRVGPGRVVQNEEQDN